MFRLVLLIGFPSLILIHLLIAGAKLAIGRTGQTASILIFLLMMRQVIATGLLWQTNITRSIVYILSIGINDGICQHMLFSI